MTDQLQWRRADDLTQVGSVDGVDLYRVKREASFRNHPAQDWDYEPQRIADPTRVIDGGNGGNGKYTDSKFARQACQDDLDQQARQAAASGDDHGR